MTSIIGESPQIVEIRKLIENVADTGLNILITGETGVGKGVVATSLHNASPRDKMPLVTVNCAALPEALLESELYGYVKGAFTGAIKNRQGKFSAADNGVLFLDEIGDMPFSLQSKILHVLQTGTYSPLGSDHEVHCDVWLIAATNQDLDGKIENKSFRADLFYRLNIIRIHVPPLRERREDIPLLIHHYMGYYLEQYPKREIEKPSASVLHALSELPWPGNIRQLQNMIKKQLVVNDWGQIIHGLECEKEGLTADGIHKIQMPEKNEIARQKANTNPLVRPRAADEYDAPKNRRRRKGDLPKDSILNTFFEAGGNGALRKDFFIESGQKKKCFSRRKQKYFNMCWTRPHGIACKLQKF